jgi:hypothetical protein
MDLQDLSFTKVHVIIFVSFCVYFLPFVVKKMKFLLLNQAKH